jgi:hypothetical protein
MLANELLLGYFNLLQLLVVVPNLLLVTVDYLLLGGSCLGGSLDYLGQSRLVL